MNRSRSAISGTSSGPILRNLASIENPLKDMDDEIGQSFEEKDKSIETLKKSSAHSSKQSELQSLNINKGKNFKEKNNDESDVDDDEEEEDDDDERSPSLEGVYNPSDFEHLNVSADIKELFQYITRYTPQAIELEHKLKPFIPDFIPAVGDIDAFIKVMRPDAENENLGLAIIDEPSAKQSDPTVLDLQLRAISKETTSKQVAVKVLEDSEKNVKEIDGWIKSISDLHRSKPPPAVHYSRNMPSIDQLMQEWDPEFEELLKEVKLPSADMDCDLSQYVEIICALLDIPIHNSKIQSLHVLFSLYMAFTKHQHFQSQTRNEDRATEKDIDGVDQLIL